MKKQVRFMKEVSKRANLLLCNVLQWFAVYPDLTYVGLFLAVNCFYWKESLVM